MEAKRSPYLKHLYVCVNRRTDGRACCAGRDSEQIREKLKEYVNAHGLKGKVRVSGSGCMDLCEQGANVMVYPDHRWYSGVTLESAEQIIEEQLAPLVTECHSRESENLIPACAGMTTQDEIASQFRPSTGSGRTGDVRALLFDLGNVLVKFDHRGAAQKISQGTGASAEDLFRLFFESPLVVQHDEGRISTRQFYEEVKQLIGLSLPYDRFLDVWNDIFIEDLEMMKLLRRLLLDYPCYLISNTNRPHFEFLRAKFPILHSMDGWILSYEVGHLKPHPVIYQRALEMTGVPAAEILYVDDREDLIEAGRQVGFQTHRFTGFGPLTRELTAKGISL